MSDDDAPVRCTKCGEHHDRSCVVIDQVEDDLFKMRCGACGQEGSTMHLRYAHGWEAQHVKLGCANHPPRRKVEDA